MYKRHLAFIFATLLQLATLNGTYLHGEYDNERELLDESVYQALVDSSAGYTRPHSVDKDLWESLKPYLLPYDSPIRPILDEIFSKPELLRSIYAFKEAGFKILTKKTHKIIVAKHELLEGYVVKAYSNSAKRIDHAMWVKRIDVADAIRNKIAEYGYEEILKVPHKWIYPLPKEGRNNKHFILIAEDMDILGTNENWEAYKVQMDEYRLEALYRIIKELHLRESVYVFNSPFSRDGKIAFVDTEYGLDPVKINYHLLRRHLSEEMKACWEGVVNRYSH